MNSDLDMVPHQSNLAISSLEVNGGAIIFMFKRFSHYDEIFRMVSRDSVSMVDTCSPRTLSRRDLNIKVPPELY